jgi:hypothetical protein
MLLESQAKSLLSQQAISFFFTVVSCIPDSQLLLMTKLLTKAFEIAPINSLGQEWI